MFQANSMGLLGSGRGRGRGVARGRGLTTWVAAGITPQQPPVIGRGRGRGMTKTQVMATRTLDRRPKVVEVTGFEAEEKDDMHVHLKVCLSLFFLFYVCLSVDGLYGVQGWRQPKIFSSQNFVFQNGIESMDRSLWAVVWLPPIYTA